MGQGLWRVARNQQLQQEYGEHWDAGPGLDGEPQDLGMEMGANPGQVPPSPGVGDLGGGPLPPHPHPRRHPQHCQGADIYQLLRARRGKEQQGFIDLEMLPPELSITILSYLNATDLCLASCVWQDLGHDEYLWQGLCKSTWGHCSIYNRRLPYGFSYRRLYMMLDEGSLTFNANHQEGISYFMSKGILVDHPKDLAKFIFCTRTLNWKMLRVYLDERRDVLDELVTLHNFSNQFLPNALRDFFRHIHAPEERGEYLETLITKFSHRFCACNPVLVREVGLSPAVCPCYRVLYRSANTGLVKAQRTTFRLQPPASFCHSRTTPNSGSMLNKSHRLEMQCMCSATRSSCCL
ncbi:F-box only protein 8 isoform X2 [Salmo trutta]|nr:F-box only protein 8-like isoform X2 [Salmo trutta]